MPRKKVTPGKELKEKRNFAKRSGAEQLMNRINRTKKRAPELGSAIGRGIKTGSQGRRRKRKKR